uniref:Uncharacterized protein n=1 Tax=Glossina brevipalpis TaxID=37001 RepID=A0A1A9WYT8_9MUSC
MEWNGMVGNIEPNSPPIFIRNASTTLSVHNIENICVSLDEFLPLCVLSRFTNEMMRAILSSKRGNTWYLLWIPYTKCGLTIGLFMILLVLLFALEDEFPKAFVTCYIQIKNSIDN